MSVGSAILSLLKRACLTISQEALHLGKVWDYQKGELSCLVLHPYLLDSISPLLGDSIR